MSVIIEPKWISEQSVLALHDRQIAEFGGGSGVRDIGLLQSALAKPQNAFHYEQVTSLTRLAAAYAYGIVKNHAFIDGNKRTAYMTCYLFLLKNGYVVKGTDEERYGSLLALAESAISEEQYVRWLDTHAVKE